CRRRARSRRASQRRERKARCFSWRRSGWLVEPGTVTQSLRREKGTGSALDVLEDELSALQSVEFVHCDPVCSAYRAGQRIERAEAHCLQPAALLQQLQLEMAFSNDALGLDRERVAEERRRKALAPHVRFEHPGDLERVIRRLELAVGLDDPRSLLLRQHA